MNGTVSTFVYDGDGNRIKKTEGGQTIVYVNGFYEKNITTSEITTNYFLGGRLIAQRKGTVLQYLHQDHLTGTSITSNDSGSQVSTIKYFAFGATRAGSVSTDIKFTGQRLDSTGLYYFNARYYDTNIGRFISADNFVQDIENPQSLNRYSYCFNNPLKYIDPTGCYGEGLPEGSTGNLGWDSDIGYVIWIAGSWQPISGEAVNCIVAWNMNNSFKNWANIINDFVSNRDPELPIGMREDKEFEIDGEKYALSYNRIYNKETDKVESQLTISHIHHITTQDVITTCDDIATASDISSFIPGFNVQGYVISAVFSTISVGLTVSEYLNGNVSQQDMGRAWLNWGISFLPGWGLTGTGVQSAMDHGLWNSWFPK